jgi:hypothetical protein
MVPPPEPTEYLYELRAIAENINRERGHHSELHPEVANLYEAYIVDSEVQVTNASNADTCRGVDIPEAAEVVQPRVEPDSNQNGEEADGRDAGVQAGPAREIPMTQAKSLEDLPSQLDLECQDSASLTPNPSHEATRNLGQELEAVASSPVHDVAVVVEVDTFAEVSQIAQEVVMDATQ